MSDFPPDADLRGYYQCLPDLRLTLSAPFVLIAVGSSRVRLPVEALALLEQFAVPNTLISAVDALRHKMRVPSDWVRVTTLLSALVQAGIIVPIAQREAQHAAALPAQEVALLHQRLLEDTFRTEQYFEALRRVVKPSDRVLEIGTGTGILALGAVQAGARHVDAIESDPVIHAAAQVINANGLQDRITLYQAWSTNIELPERADVLVSEIVSNGVFGQGVLQATYDAVTRLLKPDARLIPDRVRLYAAPVQLDEHWRSAWQFTPTLIERWNAVYHLELSALKMLDAAVQTGRMVYPQELEHLTYLSDSTLLVELDLRAQPPARLEQSIGCSIKRRGTLHGVLLYFEADLAPGLTLTTDLRTPARPVSWANPIWFCTPRLVTAGEHLTITLEHPYQPSVWDYRVMVAAP